MVWTGNISPYARIRVVATESNVNNSANASDVNVEVWLDDLTNTTGSYDNYNNSITTKIDGVQVGVISPFTYTLSGGESRKLASYKRTIPHNADGSKTANIYVFANMVDNTDVTINQSLVLTKIPRASSFTAQNIKAGASGIPITLTKSPIAATHKATISYNGTNLFASKDVGANPTNIPISPAEWETFYNLTKTVVQGQVLVTLASYDSKGAYIASATANPWVYYAGTDVPTITGVTATETNANIGTKLSGNFLDLISKIKVDITGASGTKGSTIVDTEVTIYKDSALVLTIKSGQTFNPSGYGSYAAYWRVKDSMGLWSAKKSIPITVMQYKAPQIQSYSIIRTDSAGTNEVVDGIYSKHTFKASVQSVIVGGVEKNLLKYYIYKVTAPTGTVLNTKTVLNTSVDTSEVLGTYDSNLSYEFNLVVQDNFGGETVYAQQLPASYFTMFWKKKGISLTGKYDDADLKGISLQVFDTAHFKKDVTFDTEIQALGGVNNLLEKVGTFTKGYEKYTDGRLKVWKEIDYSSTTLSGADPLFSSSLLDMGAFTVPFTNSDVEMTVSVSECSLNGFFVVVNTKATATNAPKIFINKVGTTNASPSVLKVRYTAIGRWK